MRYIIFGIKYGEQVITYSRVHLPKKSAPKMHIMIKYASTEIRTSIEYTQGHNLLTSVFEEKI